MGVMNIRVYETEGLLRFADLLKLLLTVFSILLLSSAYGLEFKLFSDKILFFVEFKLGTLSLVFFDRENPNYISLIYFSTF